MLQVFTEVLRRKKLHQSARRGIITLLEKTGKDACYISNWRPLMLLNVDHKILAKILATQINIVLPKLINPMQSGFIKNRNIADNILSLVNLLEHTKANNIPAIILSIDFEKAFDTIEWSAIEKTLRHLNFGVSCPERSRLFGMNLSCEHSVHNRIIQDLCPEQLKPRD